MTCAHLATGAGRRVSSARVRIVRVSANTEDNAEVGTVRRRHGIHPARGSTRTHTEPSQPPGSTQTHTGPSQHPARTTSDIERANL